MLCKLLCRSCNYPGGSHFTEYVFDGLQSNRMDTNDEYVEYDEDNEFRSPEAKQPPKTKRYRDDAYRCVLCATIFLTHCCGMQRHIFALVRLP